MNKKAFNPGADKPSPLEGIIRGNDRAPAQSALANSILGNATPGSGINIPGVDPAAQYEVSPYTNKEPGFMGGPKLNKVVPPTAAPMRPGYVTPAGLPPVDVATSKGAMDNTTQFADLLNQSIKIAQAYKAKAEAVAPLPTAEIEKAAKALVDSGWITEKQAADAARVLSNHAEALKTMIEISTKSAEVIADLRQQTGKDPRLNAGTATKAASENRNYDTYIGTRPETDADRDFSAKMLAYHQQLREGVA